MYQFAFFFTNLFLLFCCSLQGQNSCSDSYEKNDSILFIKKQKQLIGLKFQTNSELQLEIAKSFIGTPYKSATLEKPGSETLVVNLRELDCTTFVETCMALAATFTTLNTDFNLYKRNLQFIRYRNGLLNGYNSRLHYFTDWIFDNSQKGIIEDITIDLGGISFVKTINFMSTHANKYPALAAETNLIEGITEIEKNILSHQYFYIPKEKLYGIENQLHEGWIVAFTTGIAGLDVIHTGFTIRVGNRIYLLHASSDKGKVAISDKPLVDYIMENKLQTGMMILKLKNREINY